MLWLRVKIIRKKIRVKNIYYLIVKEISDPKSNKLKNMRGTDHN